MPKYLFRTVLLEELNVIKVLNKDISKRYFQKKYAGKLPSELADKLHEEIEKGRKEWGEISIEMKITSNTNAVGVAYLLTPEGCNYYSDKIVSRAKALE